MEGLERDAEGLDGRVPCGPCRTAAIAPRECLTECAASRPRCRAVGSHSALDRALRTGDGIAGVREAGDARSTSGVLGSHMRADALALIVDRMSGLLGCV